MRKDAFEVPGLWTWRRGSWAPGLLATALLAAAGSASAGPTSALYLTDFGKTIRVVQGDAVINSWIDNAGGGIDSLTALAVADTVRTYAQGGAASPSQGAEYTLDGVFTGALYANTVGGPFRDGTTDGKYNYAVREAISDPLYRFSRDWSDPEVLPVRIFGTVGLGAVTGITFDPRNGTFWLIEQDLIYNLTLAGDLLSYFNTGTSSPFNQALAFDPADNTLWLSSYENHGAVLRQYDPTPGLPGTRAALDSLFLPGVLVAGAEFALPTAAATVPEPAAWAMLILGFGVAGARLRRRRARTSGESCRSGGLLAGAEKLRRASIDAAA